MKKGENFNRPKKGDQIKVEPIRELKDIKAIKQILKDKPRNYCLFVLGINTNLRASDLLNLRAHQVVDLRPDDEIEIKEKKTGKLRRITLNKNCVEAIDRLLNSEKFKNGDFIFRSQRAPRLTVPSVTRLVKSWCKTINLKGNFGSHTLRKTWGYHQRVTFGRGLPELMTVFNHSSQQQTLSYLCVQPEEVKNIYKNML